MKSWITKNSFFTISIAMALNTFGQSVLGDSVNTTNCQHDDSSIRCVKYIKNYDADTITVEIPGVHPLLGKNISVRVNGIDAPEIKGKNSCEKDAAREAQQQVEKLLKAAKQINLDHVDRDKYFRILADVSVDGKSIKDFLLERKLAYEYNGGTKKSIDWCRYKLNSYLSH